MAIIALFLVLVGATWAQAAPITWQASSTLSTVHDPHDLLSGLEVGTIWTLTVTFDPASAARTLAPGCNEYASGAASLVLGGYTYTQPSGKIYTNAVLPAYGCTPASFPDSPPGLIAFTWGPNWTQEAGAWNLNDPFALLVAGYYDLNAKDGSLPYVPVLDPNGGQFHGLDFNHLYNDMGFGGAFEPQALEQPTPVPEPATMAMMAAGLAALAARRRRVTAGSGDTSTSPAPER
jgi:hypothetical protein